MFIGFKCFEQIKRTCSNLVHNSCMQICDTVSWLSRSTTHTMTVRSGRLRRMINTEELVLTLQDKYEGKPTVPVEQRPVELVNILQKKEKHASYTDESHH